MKPLLTDELNYELLEQKRDSKFDWININCGKDRVGKVRGILETDCMIINSINIFPEFEGQGYGSRVVNMFKSKFDIIIADRVRPTARGFWEKLGFYSGDNTSYVWSRGKEMKAQM